MEWIVWSLSSLCCVSAVQLRERLQAAKLQEPCGTVWCGCLSCMCTSCSHSAAPPAPAAQSALTAPVLRLALPPAPPSSLRVQWQQGKGSSTLRLQWRAPGSRVWEELPVSVPPAAFGTTPGRWTPLN